MSLTVDFEESSNVYKVAQLAEATRGLVTVYVNGRMLEEHFLEGWKFLRKCDTHLHGYNHIHLSQLNERQQSWEIGKAVEVYKRFFGVQPKGWRSPFLDFNQNTLRLLFRHGFLWDSSYKQSRYTWLRRMQSPVYLLPIHNRTLNPSLKGTVMIHCYEITNEVLEKAKQTLPMTHSDRYAKAKTSWLGEKSCGC